MLKLKAVSSLLIFLHISFWMWGRQPGTATVLIFDHIPPYVRSVSPFPKFVLKDSRTQITIFDNFYRNDFNPKSSVNDTIVFSTISNKIVLTFLYSMGHEPLNYVIDKGDTITFEFENGVPYARSNKDSKNDYFLNYDRNRLIANEKNELLDSFKIYRNPHLSAKNVNDALNGWHNRRKIHYMAARAYLNNELIFLFDSKDFRPKKPESFYFFQDKLKYQIAILDFEQNKLNTDSLRNMLFQKKQKSEHFSYSYFLPFLERVSDSVNVKPAKVLKYENGRETDYRDVYERTSSWSDVNDFYKKQLLFKYLKRIGELFSLSDLQKYLYKFSSFTNDTLLVNRIKREFLITDDSIELDNDKLIMIDAEDSAFSLQEFLKLNKGRLIYIDFWASWCTPCRIEMKKAGRLRADFKDKEVVFVYLSLDKSKSNWMKASDEEGLSDVEYNYILKNVESSVFLKSINFGSIPRYLLYDKQGKLVHKSAPGPGSEEVRHLLTNYLAE